ncbi:hypothetical protein F4861DRAFT_424278 [Xylaria intraflava]|nr:hypothetical protein F4861DRAFT_424278 [Xylaria intraflava]
MVDRGGMGKRGRLDGGGGDGMIKLGAWRFMSFFLLVLCLSTHLSLLRSRMVRSGRGPPDPEASFKFYLVRREVLRTLKLSLYALSPMSPLQRRPATSHPDSRRIPGTYLSTLGRYMPRCSAEGSYGIRSVREVSNESLKLQKVPTVRLYLTLSTGCNYTGFAPCADEECPYIPM